MKKIYLIDYSDYRKFLADYYTNMRKSIPRFTYELWAAKAGFSSPSFIQLLIKGKRNCTRDSVIKLTQSMKMTKKEASYFKWLVFFNQTKNLQEKLLYLHKLDRTKPSDTPRLLRSDEYRYLEKWYIPLIREMVDLPFFNASPRWIAKMSEFPIQRRKIEKALQFLIEAGYLFRDDKGRLRKIDKTVRAAPGGAFDPMNLAIKNIHCTMLKLAQSAAAEMPANKRYITNAMLSLSRNAYDAAIERIRQLKAELLAIASADNCPEKIYQLGVSLFPLTKDNTPGAGKP